MNSRSMAGWIGFAGILMLVVGSIDFMQGLIALFEDEYFVVTQSGYLVVDLTAWGWVMLIWGVLLVLAGLGLLSAQSWARWFAIVVPGVVRRRCRRRQRHRRPDRCWLRLGSCRTGPGGRRGLSRTTATLNVTCAGVGSPAP